MKSRLKRVISLVLTFAFMFGMFTYGSLSTQSYASANPAPIPDYSTYITRSQLSYDPNTTAASSYSDLDLSAGHITITSSGAYRIYQSGSGSTSNLILVDGNIEVDLILDNVNIVNSTSKSVAEVTESASNTTYSPLIISDGAKCWITLQGDNHLETTNTGSTNINAGIAVTVGSSVIFTERSGATGTEGNSAYVVGGRCSAAIGGWHDTKSGFIMINGGNITAIADKANGYAGIGGGHYNTVDGSWCPGIVINGGKIFANGAHVGIGGWYGKATTGSASYSTPYAGQLSFIEINGGTIEARNIEAASNPNGVPQGAAIGYVTDNDITPVHINGGTVNATPYGYGAGIGGSATIGNTVNAIGAAVSGNPIITVDMTKTPQGTGAGIGGGGMNSAKTGGGQYGTAAGDMLILGGDITIDAGTYGAGIGGGGGTTSAGNGGNIDILGGTFTINGGAYGAAIGGGGTTASGGSGDGGDVLISGGNFTISGGTYGAGIGGGGSQNYAGGSGGNVTIAGNASAIQQGFQIVVGDYGAGIGGGGSASGTAGNGGSVSITGGEFDITSGRYGAGIGGGGSYGGNAGKGGNVSIDVATDISKIATSSKPQSQYSFTIQSGQFGAGIGGGGSYSGAAGAGATSLEITGGNFGITAGGNTASYDTNINVNSFGSGIGGGGSYAGNGGDGPDYAELSGGYFDVTSNGFGSAIGGGGTGTATAGGCGTIYVTGGTITAESNNSDTKGLGGGAAANGTSNVGDGTVIIIGGNVYTDAGTDITNANAGQHVWTRPNLGNLPSAGNEYTSTNWDHTIPTITGSQNPQNENTTQKGQEVGGIASNRIGQLVSKVQYAFPIRDASGNITTSNYDDYGLNDMYVTPETGTNDGAVFVWVPAGYLLNYDLTTGSATSAGGYSVDDSQEYAYGQISVIFDNGSSYPGSGQTKPLIQHGETVDESIFDNLYKGQSYANGNYKYRDLLEHGQETASDGVAYDVVFVGWSAQQDTTIYEEGQSNYPQLLEDVTFQTADITVYAVWGFDKNSNGLADIYEDGLAITYDFNQIASGTVTPSIQTSTNSVSWGQLLAIENLTATQTLNGESLVFVGWTDTNSRINDVVTPINYASYNTELGNLYLFGGSKTFTDSVGGGTYTVNGLGSYTMLSDTTLYAVWAVDSNGNGVPDYLEPTYNVIYVDNASTIATMPTDSAPYTSGQSVMLDTSTLTTTTDSSGDTVYFLYWTTDSTASSTIYGIGAQAAGILPAEVTSPYTMGSNDAMFYAVWSYDANNNGDPDAYEVAYKLLYRDDSMSGSTGIADSSGTIQPYPVEEGPYYNGDQVSTFETPSDPTGWHFEGWTDDQSLGGTYANEAAFKTAFPISTYPAPAGTFKDATNTADFTTGDITIYAVWSKDENGNGVADWEETTTPGDHYIRYVSGSNNLTANGYTLDESSMPFSSYRASGTEVVTLDENGGLKYTDGTTVTLDSAKPTVQEGNLVFLGWSPIDNLSNHIYGSSSSELTSFITHLQFIHDIEMGTDDSQANQTSATEGYDPSTGNTTGGTGYTPESMAGRQYYDRIGASAVDAYYQSGFNEYNWVTYNGEGLLLSVTQSPYYWNNNTYSTTQTGYDPSMGWCLYAVWAEDKNNNGIADMFENSYTLLYDGNGTTTNVPYEKHNILPDQTVILETGKNTTSSGYATIYYNDPSISTYPMVFLGWTADDDYNKGSFVGDDGNAYSNIYASGDYAKLPRIMSSVTFGSMDITVRAVWGADSDGNGIADVYEGSPFNLIYDGNGGAPDPTDSNGYVSGDTVTNLDDGSGMIHTTDSSYIFLYWTDDISVAGVYGQGDRSILPTEVTQVTFVGSDIVLYAVWGEDANVNGTPDVFEDPYILTYHANGGSNAPSDSTQYYWNDTATLDSGSTVTKGDYMFVGWTQADPTTFSSVYTVGQQSLLPTLDTSVTFTSTDITVYAVWSTDLNENGTPDVYENAYELEYDLNGGTDTNNIFVAQTLASGQMITIPIVTPTRDGYTFDGWTYGSTTLSAGDSFTMPSENVTFTATWKSNEGGGDDGDTEYKITYEPNGGTGSYGDTAVSGTTYTVKTASASSITRSGYTLSSWNTAADGNGTKYTAGATFTVTSDVTLYAQWTKNSTGGGSGGGGGGTSTTSYTITYDANEGTGSFSEKANSDTTYTVKTLSGTGISRSGYSLDSWNTATDGSGTKYAAGATFTVNSNVTLYAQWKKSSGSNSGSGSVSDILNTEDHMAYIIGYSDGTIKPLNNISRSEVATMFFRLLRDDVRSKNWSSRNSYADVASEAWFNNAVSTMSNLGIITGYNDGTFKGNAYITRAEFAVIAARFDSDTYTGESKFSDISGHWAAEYINRAAEKGWITGYSDGTFRPDQYITRAEAITLINRVLERDSITEMHTDMRTWSDCPSTAWYYSAVQEATNSHEYTRDESGYETWTKVLETPDWAALEKSWSSANSL